jgi:hypothetical protein
MSTVPAMKVLSWPPLVLDNRVSFIYKGFRLVTAASTTAIQQGCLFGRTR